MTIFNKVNSVWRNSKSNYTKVNGVWREADSKTKVNGVWRDVYNSTSSSTIDPNNIVGFVLIYTLNKNRIHHNIPRLKYNSKIPYICKLTGDQSSIGQMDLNHKGIIFEYLRDLPEEEGIIIYEGRLYALTKDSQMVNVCKAYGSNEGKTTEDEMVTEFSSLIDVAKLSGLDIKINGYVYFEDYGYYIEGWNNLFNTKPWIDKTIYPIKEPHKKRLELNNYNILPVDNRPAYFDSVANIGIARDMQTPVNNMVGSHGRLDHTIDRIELNGKALPFTIELYH